MLQPRSVMQRTALLVFLLDRDDNLAALVVSTGGANAVRQLGFATAWAGAERGDIEAVNPVGATRVPASARHSSFWNGHVSPKCLKCYEIVNPQGEEGGYSFVAVTISLVSRAMTSSSLVGITQTETLESSVETRPS